MEHKLCMYYISGIISNNLLASPNISVAIPLDMSHYAAKLVISSGNDTPTISTSLMRLVLVTLNIMPTYSL
jgi:hypothetical protein